MLLEEKGCLSLEEISFKKTDNEYKLFLVIEKLELYFRVFRPSKGFKFTFNDYCLIILN